jgi:hypothetical protein
MLLYTNRMISKVLRSSPVPIFVRTHNDLQTNKRELLFRRNHWGSALSVRSDPPRKKDLKMSNEKHDNLKNVAHQQNGEKPLATAAMTDNAFPGGFQAIASAYGDYTKKSFEDTKSFFEKLSSVRSFDRAIEVQTEFANTAYETFVSESQKIAALYGDLAKHSFKSFDGLVTKTTPTRL